MESLSLELSSFSSGVERNFSSIAPGHLRAAGDRLMARRGFRCPSLAIGTARLWSVGTVPRSLDEGNSKAFTDVYEHKREGRKDK